MSIYEEGTRAANAGGVGLILSPLCKNGRAAGRVIGTLSIYSENVEGHWTERRVETYLPHAVYPTREAWEVPDEDKVRSLAMW
jgi:hypothetical protein